MRRRPFSFERSTGDPMEKVLSSEFSLAGDRRLLLGSISSVNLWLGRQDSNLDPRIQSPVCCRYTTPHYSRFMADATNFITCASGATMSLCAGFLLHGKPL